MGVFLDKSIKDMVDGLNVIFCLTFSASMCGSKKPMKKR